MKQCIKGILILLKCIFIFNMTAVLQAQNLEQIYEPKLVGQPNSNAFNGLIQLQGGELRHYGYERPRDDTSALTYYYISSEDNGLTWERKNIKDPDLFTGESSPPAAQSPLSGDFIRVVSSQEGTFVMRSSQGIDGTYQKERIDDDRHIMIRQPYFLGNKKRILVAGHRYLPDIEKLQTFVFYSDDDGHHWEKSAVPIGPTFKVMGHHAKPRWENNAVEPTIMELNDGRLWMILRTSMDNLYESFSTDYGATWSNSVPTRFYSTLTMPTLFRLQDGRIILFSNFTTPLPEVDRSDDTSIREEQRTGSWEDVFTNRDVLHAAISNDDGNTWSGFRELYLNPLRNESDFATRGGTEVSLDKSVHQSQAVELPYGKVLLAFGQHPLVRSMIIFDPDWLNETSRQDNFKKGLSHWSTFKYVEGIRGHAAYNRVPGPGLIDHPDKKGSHVLHIRREINRELVNDVDGALWNFPAAMKGSFTTRIYLQPGSKGGRISLLDRWFNPTDTTAHEFAMYNLEFDGQGNTNIGPLLSSGDWNELTFEWDNLKSGNCRVLINGKIYKEELPLNFSTMNGINYVHFQSVAGEEDKHGYLIESVKAKAFPAFPKK